MIVLEHPQFHIALPIKSNHFLSQFVEPELIEYCFEGIHHGLKKCQGLTDRYSIDSFQSFLVLCD